MDINENLSPPPTTPIYLTRLVFLPSHLAGTVQAVGIKFGQTASGDHSQELDIVVKGGWVGVIA